MKSLRSRLILSHLIPLIILIPLFAIVIFNVAQSQSLLVELSDRVSEQAQLIADKLVTRPDVWTSSVQAQTYVDDFSRTFQMNITLIRPGGDVLASNTPNAQSQEVEIVQEFIHTEEDENGKRVEHIVLKSNANDTLVSVPVLDSNQQLLGILQVEDQLTDVYYRFENLQWLMLGLVIASVIIALLVGLFLALRLDKNLHGITTAITGVAAGKELAQVPEKGPKEIQAVLQAFNQLLLKLRNSEESRRRLLANLVHEIGQPLGAMSPAIRALKQGAYQDDELRQQLLSGLETHLLSMQPMLDNLAQLHKQIIGTPKQDIASTKMSEWLQDLIQIWMPAMKEKNLKCFVEIQPDLPTLSIDQQQMGQAISNLISNAIKYTPTDGTVHFTGKSDTKSLLIIVEDTGVGIQPEDFDKIFEPFYRVNSGNRFPQGMGLGLSIARDIVEGHGGTVRVETGSEGIGCRFIISLPNSLGSF